MNSNTRAALADALAHVDLESVLLGNKKQIEPHKDGIRKTDKLGFEIVEN